MKGKAKGKTKGKGKRTHQEIEKTPEEIAKSEKKKKEMEFLRTMLKGKESIVASLAQANALLDEVEHDEKLSAFKDRSLLCVFEKPIHLVLMLLLPDLFMMLLFQFIYFRKPIHLVCLNSFFCF